MIYQLAAIDATHLHIIYRIKRRIEMTDIIYHLYQIIHIDDEFLIDLHKLIEIGRASCRERVLTSV